jgi:hypothetical protein
VFSVQDGVGPEKTGENVAIAGLVPALSLRLAPPHFPCGDCPAMTIEKSLVDPGWYRVETVFFGQPAAKNRIIPWTPKREKI